MVEETSSPVTGVNHRTEATAGKDITAIGSDALVRSLSDDGLLDELQLRVHFVILGSGKRLFEGGGKQEALKSVDSKTFSTGVIFLTFRPITEK
ncbi:dihydrofolate reductase family protein [Haladaptatus halobius]|uniref:dihydrofolate reductase family protein n=1 Tax=Haladaptatus halobius TaxID=2884875 RepID=UPI001D0A03D3|nr:dihydrofolate reductase family protein [Haladaptatus halobius]